MADLPTTPQTHPCEFPVGTGKRFWTSPSASIPPLGRTAASFPGIRRRRLLPSQAPEAQAEASSLADLLADGPPAEGQGVIQRTRKRDPRLTCANFLAGRVPCACPEEEEVTRKRAKVVPGCEADISHLKGYHRPSAALIRLSLHWMISRRDTVSSAANFTSYQILMKAREVVEENWRGTTRGNKKSCCCY